MATRYETSCLMTNPQGKSYYAFYDAANMAEVKDWVRNASSTRLEFTVRHYSDMHGPFPFRVIARAYRKMSGEYVVDADWKI